MTARDDGIRRLTPVRDQPPAFITADEFPDIAREQWSAAKDAYAEAFKDVSSLHYLLHKPGQVRVSGTVTGALATAKRLRDEADRMVIAFDAIVQAGNRVKS